MTKKRQRVGANKMCPKVSLGVERHVSAPAGGARWNPWRGGVKFRWSSGSSAESLKGYPAW